MYECCCGRAHEYAVRTVADSPEGMTPRIRKIMTMYRLSKNRADAPVSLRFQNMSTSCCQVKAYSNTMSATEGVKSNIPLPAP